MTQMRPDGSPDDGATTGATSGSASGHERLVQDGFDHLQRAARETIAAMRALLDLAEELVDDPAAAETLVATIGSFAGGAIRSGAAVVQMVRPSAPPPPEDGDDDTRVQRIPVS